jgi:hypothetical protein
MTEMLAYCGLVCDTCPIHLATLETDKGKQERMRAEIVRMCKEHYGMVYAIDEITDCDGCLTDGERLFSACKNCLIRACARGKNLQNCAFCPDFSCEKLEAIFKTDTEARKRLIEIKEKAWNTL